MVLIETSFPRGGSAPQSSETKENIVFGARLEKRKSDKKKVHKKIDDDDNDENIKSTNNIEAVSAELLNYKTVQEGMIIMGTVKSVDAICLKISLPGCMIGKVIASSISASYNKILKEFVVSSDKVQNFKPLTEMYEIGQNVYAKVTEIKENEAGNKLEINLSVKPSDVHSNLYHGKIKKGMIFNGAIEEIQEHGYIIETGIKNLRCFLPIDKINQNQLKKFGIGELVFLKIDKFTQTTNASTAVCKLITDENKRKIKDLIEPNLDYLLPTTLVNFTITKILKDGLQGTIMNDLFTGYINEHQLSEPFSLPEDYSINSTMIAKILYIMPLTKLIYLSLNLNKNDENITKYQRGDIIENAVVHHNGTGGIIFVLNNREKGIMSFKSIKTNYINNYDQDDILSKYHKRSKHKIRIIEYDPMDSLYICSDNSKILNEKYFSLNDCKVGEFVSVTINEKDKISGSYYVHLGNCRGLIEKIFLSPTTFNIQDNQKIRCRIMAINSERNVVYLTNRSEYMAKNATILTSIKQAKENRVCLGTIVKCTERFFIVKFFNNIKGILYKSKITGFLSTELNSFHEGQTMCFRIITREDDKLLLDMIDNTYKIGEICNGKISNCLQTGLEIEIEKNVEQQTIKGLIPIRLLSEFPDLYSLKLHTLKAGDSIEVANINKTIFSLRDVEYFQNVQVKNFKSLKNNDILRAFIKNVDSDIVELLLPISGYDKLLRIHLKMLLLNISSNPNIVVYPDQIIYVKVLSKDIRTKSLTVSAKLTDVWDGDLKFSGILFGKYLSELTVIREHLKKYKNPLGQIQIGEHLNGTMAVKIKDTGDWYVQISNGLQGLIKKSIIAKDTNIEEGQAVNLVVLWIDYQNEIIYCSHKQNDIDKIDVGNKIPKNLIDKSGINSKILLCLDNVIICSLKKGKNPLAYVPTKMHYNDFSGSAVNTVKEGDFCRLTFIHNNYPIAVFESTKKLWLGLQSRKRKMETEMEEVFDKKRKKISCSTLHPKIILHKSNERILDDINSDNDSDDNESNLGNTSITSSEKQNIKTTITKPLKESDKKINLKKKFKEMSDEKKYIKSKKSSEVSNSLPGASGFWSTNLETLKLNTNEINDSSSEDDNINKEELAAKKKKKLTTSERFQIEKAEEARLREIEEKYANPNVQPETADQFDRLVLSDPNNSKNWINYMVFHLQATEIDKARTIARKALKSISFREQDELLNIWVALLNLELRYGTKESFTDIFKESQLCNDPIKIYTRVLEILTDAKKTQELIDLVGTMTKKFRDNSEIWKKCANSYFTLGLHDKAKQLMHRALAVLPDREHVNIIVGFAILHHRYGDSEIAHTLLEQIISSYPKRVDVWSQYIDMLVKDQQIDSARRTLERAVIQKIPIKKMRILFKKYLEFEEIHGSEENVQKVKGLAANYVKNEIMS